MFMQIRMPLACLLILAYSFCYYKLNRRLNTQRAIIFEAMTWCGLVHLLAATVTEYTVNNRESVSVLCNSFWHLVFLISATSVCALLSLYMLMCMEKRTRVSKKTEKLVLQLTWCVAVLLHCVLPITYVDTPNGSYSLGPKAYVLYGVVVVALGIMGWNLILHFREMGRANFIVFTASILVFLVCAAIQMVFPYILITDLGVTMIIMGIMMSMEDGSRFYDYQLHTKNELGFRELADELCRQNQPFAIGAYVFRAVPPQAVVEQLRAYYGKASLCALTYNTIAVVPYYRQHHFEDIPLLPLGEGDGLLGAQMIRFPQGCTVEQVRLETRAFHTACVEKEYLVDELTGALRRSSYISRVNAAVQSGQGFAFLMLDVDDFKGINDTFGHNAGDLVLRGIVESFQNSLRQRDAVCRMGGDEFSVLLSGVQQQDRVLEILERITCQAKRIPVVEQKNIPLQVCVGVKIYRPEDGWIPFEALYEAADKALYDAKNSGKNRICFAPER